MITDLNNQDLDTLDWVEPASHLVAVAAMIERARNNTVDYLAVRDSEGTAVAIGAVDYTYDVPMLTQLVVHPNLRRNGLGTMLIAELEHAAQRRGHNETTLMVKLTNPDAERLYRELGYRETRQTTINWIEHGNNGNASDHSVDVRIMTKTLN